MPRLLDTGDRADVIAAAVARIISTRGTAALSMRAISSECGISAASILQHLTNKERLLRVCTHRWTTAWADARRGRARVEGVRAFLPGTQEDVADVRVWFGLLEIGRTNLGAAAVLNRDAAVERDLLGQVAGCVLDDTRLDTLVAVIHGLRLALCAPEEPMPLARATAVLDQFASNSVTSAS